MDFVSYSGTPPITYIDPRVGGMGLLKFGVHIGVHRIPKEVKEYQKGWQGIKDVEAYKIRGLGRFYNVIKTLPKPHLSD